MDRSTYQRLIGMVKSMLQRSLALYANLTSSRDSMEIKLKGVSDHLSIEELASIIIHMNSEEQAELISKMAYLLDFCAPIQLQWVSDEPGLSAEGRSLMSLIGEYS